MPAARNTTNTTTAKRPAQAELELERSGVTAKPGRARKRKAVKHHPWSIEHRKPWVKLGISRITWYRRRRARRDHHG